MAKILHHLSTPFSAMAGILALGMASPAHANLEIWLSTDLITYTLVADAPSGWVAGTSFSGVYGDFTINMLSAGSNSPGIQGSSIGAGTASLTGSASSTHQ